jgi:hypothetical protein
MAMTQPTVIPARRVPWRVPLLLAIMSQPLFSALATESPPDRLRIAGVVLKWIRTDREAKNSV